MAQLHFTEIDTWLDNPKEEYRTLGFAAR